MMSFNLYGKKKGDFILYARAEFSGPWVNYHRKVEIFVTMGEKVLTTSVFPDEDAYNVAAFTTGGKAVILSLTVWNLSKIKVN